jgi:hypothetical protein
MYKCNEVNVYITLVSGFHVRVDTHADAVSSTARVADDKSNSGVADPLAGTGEGTGAM